MIAELRLLNSLGLKKLEEVFSEPEEERAALANAIAWDNSLTEVVAIGVTIPMPATRLEFAKAIDSYIGPGSEHSSLAQNPLLWSWIGAASMQVLFDAGNKIGKRTRWIYTSGSMSAYRHIFSSAYISYQSHRTDTDSAMAILHQPLGVPGEVVEQIMATRALAGSVGAELATALYFDKSKQANKPGSAGKGEGSSRRLVAFLNQIRLTIDIKSMKTAELLALLPSEFSKFKP